LVFLILAIILAAILVWLGRRRSGRVRADARLAALAVAAVASAGALASLLKGAWVLALLLGGLASWLWARLSAAPRKLEAQAPAPSAAKARALLGVGPDATPQEIQAAYLRLIRTVHPDRGGTSGLAAELNAARDRLLGR
jgi:DnaJ domain